MKIKIYILTYNNEHHINSGISSLLSSDLSKHDVQIFVINNHTNLVIWDDLRPHITILDNVMQPDFGMGHSSRNWNQALMLGFQDLNNPDCDLVICAQDDTMYDPQWLNVLVKHHEAGMEFIACGIGDNLCSYTVNAIKKIGMWDERFCMLAYGEHDYFLRAVMHLGDKCSINDYAHHQNGRMTYQYNKIPETIVIRPEWSGNKLDLHNERGRSHLLYICRDLFIAKWGGVPETMPVSNYAGKPMKPLIMSYLFYPYFENKVDNLNELGYNWGQPYSY